MRTVLVAVVLAAVASVAMVTARAGLPGSLHTVTIRASASGWTDAQRPNTVMPQGPLLMAGGGDRRSYLRFDLGPVTGGTVTRARLLLTPAPGTRIPTRDADLTVRRVSGDWSPDTLTHNRRPAVVPDPVDSGQTTAATTLHADRVAVELDPTAFALDASISLQLRDSRPGATLRVQRLGTATPSLLLTFEPASTVDHMQPTVDQELAVNDADSIHSSKQVFAHYFPPYPISIDNEPAEQDYYTRNYLDPQGEGGKHAAYGGLLRDRPLPVPPGPEPGWRLRNLEQEVRQAKAAGIDGFVVDLLSASGRNWDATVHLLQAAENVGGFSVVPMVDATSSFAELSPTLAADKLAQLYRRPATYRVGQDYLLSSFAAERKPVEWWRQLITTLQDRHHIPITFQAVFLNPGPENLEAFAPIADGYGDWGVRTVEAVERRADLAAVAHRMGKTWIEPVAMQDVRPRSSLYAESSNTEAPRAMFTRARTIDADYIQLVTWNDYSESTQIAPSQSHGWALLSIISYYAAWFHTGDRPALTADTVVITHRTQFVASSARPTMSPTLGGSDTPPRDTVEVLLLLTAPARLTVTVGEDVTRYRAAAGVSTLTVALRPGTVRAVVERSGVVQLAVPSPYRVVTDPTIRDLQYYAVAETR